MKNLDDFLFLGAILLAIAAVALPIYKMACSDGRVDYCRIKYDNNDPVHPPVYLVEGHRNWRPDIYVAIALTPEEAATKQKELCPQ